MKYKNLTILIKFKEQILAHLAVCPWGMSKEKKMQAMGLELLHHH